MGADPMSAAFSDLASSVAALISLTVVGLLAFVAWVDLATRTIPDWISAALLLLGVAIRINAGIGAVAASLAVGVVMFLLLALVHARGMLGGGDVKLMASLAVQFSPLDSLRLVAATSIIGGVLVLLHFALRGLPAPARSPAGSWRPRRLFTNERWRVRRGGSLPYGVAIAGGGVWTILSGWGA